MLPRDGLAALLQELDLLKYIPEDVPEPEPEPVEEGLSVEELQAVIEQLQAEVSPCTSVQTRLPCACFVTSRDVWCRRTKSKCKFAKSRRKRRPS